MYLISGYFDESTNKTLKKLIDKIAKVSGNSFMTDHKVPPHLTIAAIEAKSVDELVKPFETLKGTIGAGDIQIVSVGMLLPYVIYATPVLNAYLSELSEGVFKAIKDISGTTISKYYKPGNWLPHITLGKTLSKEQMKEAMEVAYDSFQPIKGEIVRIGLSTVNPHTDVACIEFK